MASRLDPTWAHLPSPAPAAAAGHCYSSHAWLTPAAAFENEALTSALRASMSPAAASSCCRPATPSSSSATTSSGSASASDRLPVGHDAAPPTPASGTGRPALARPKARRVSKRKSRPSRRAQTTYISADPANFSRMVQEVTGLPVPGGRGRSSAAPSWTAAPACVLPTLDTSASFLLDRAVQVPAPAPVTGGGAPGAADAAVAAPDEGSSSVLLDELEAMLCAPAGGAFAFPTLESCWEIN